MNQVLLDAAGNEVEVRAIAPRRVVLPAAALHRLAALCGVTSPVDTMVTSTGSLGDIASRLGAHDVDAGPATPRADIAIDVVEVDVMLRATGLVDDEGHATTEGRAVMQVWDSPALAVELEMLLALPGGRVRMRSWHRNLDEWVVCISTADGARFEVVWLAAEDWWLELGRAVHVDRERLGTPPELDQPLPDVIETPWELLLATGEAVATRRTDLLDQLVVDHAALTFAGDDVGALEQPPAPVVRGLHAALESASRGRLHATIVGLSERGRPGAGVVEWVLFHDGWRSLTPFRRDGWNMVRIQRQAATDLSRQLAVRAAGVTS